MVRPGAFAGIGILAGTITVLGAPPAAAQPQASFSGICPEGNLLTGRMPVARADARGALAQVTDGKVAPEGAFWNSAPAMIFDTPAGTLTYDLGEPTEVSAVYIQADSNDSYSVFGSLDGVAFHRLADVPSVAGDGLRGRTGSLGRAVVRYLKIGEGQGDGFYSVSEAQAFCRLPSPFPPALPVVQAPVTPPPPKSWWKWWDDTSSARVELGLALAGLALLGWSAWLTWRGRAHHRRRLRDALLGALGLFSAGMYVNFGSFHFNNFVHNWDTFHYYIGAKYFRELGYDRLYECVAIADLEFGLKRRVELRKITNLRTNVLGGSQEILADPDRCKRHFNTARWSDFKRDVGFFRGRVNTKNWEDAQTDHGFNGTPVWSIAGTFLSNLAPASSRQIVILNCIDLAYMVGMAAMVWWAFGWRVLCVALLVYATNFPSRFYWTGGAFLRYDWLFYTVAGVCLVKKDRPFLGGASLGYATLLRIFPGFLLVGPLVVAVQQLRGVWRRQDERAEGDDGAAAGASPGAAPAGRVPAVGGPPGWLARVDRRYLSLFGGAALAVSLLVPVSLVTAGGSDAYVRFVQNTAKHANTPLTNYMGLRTLVAYRPSEVGRHLRSDRLEDPWSRWKDARLLAFKRLRPVYGLLVIGFIALLAVAVRGAEPWMALSLSATTIAVGPELTCYYYSFLVAIAVLHAKRQEVGVALMALTAVTQFIAWAPFRVMSSWTDEQYTSMSLATMVAFALLLALFAFPVAKHEPAVVDAVEAAPQRSTRRRRGRSRARRGAAARSPAE